MYTLENDSCDVIRKENGLWGFYRGGEKAEFESYSEAESAKLEMKRQGKNMYGVRIIKW